jgi:hypothetical protein
MNTNPADGLVEELKKFKRGHFAALEAKDMPGFVEDLWQNAGRLFPSTRNAIELLMLTFVRTNELSATLGDVSESLVTINDVVVDGMTVTYELGAGGTNIDAVKANINAAAVGNGGGAGDAKTGGKADKVKVIIRKLRITHAEVMPSIGAAHEPIPLPDITLNNIGSDSKPASASQVASEVISKIMAETSQGVLKSGLKLPGNALGGVSSAVKGATSGLPKGLFGK